MSSILQEMLAKGEITKEAYDTLSKSEEDSVTTKYKVSDKGCISFYLPNRKKYPVSIYLGELEWILEQTVGNKTFNTEFNNFLSENKDQINEHSKWADKNIARYRQIKSMFDKGLITQEGFEKLVGPPYALSDKGCIQFNVPHRKSHMVIVHHLEFQWILAQVSGKTPSDYTEKFNEFIVSKAPN